jgi:hypothetical protein
VSSSADPVSDRIEHQHHQVDHIVAGSVLLRRPSMAGDATAAATIPNRKHVYVA